MENFFGKFKLNQEKEELSTVVTNIENGVVFRGTNLWILIFAIFVASLGLNINSPAVIIGAMLISPLMGPIMGMGLGVGINDVGLLRKSVYNYFIASGVALTTSTIFFLISPLNEAHSEILARTSPSIYDVLIALFGGFAGIIATSSKNKGNVIPGVAIATALMPPLCTAGYGLATLQLHFFYGAIYLFVINTVFIALATFIIVRLLHFPYRHIENKKSARFAQRIVMLVAFATLIPSLYLGYDLVQQDRFTKKANNFILNEAHFSNDYLLNKKIDAKKKIITLVFGGKEILPDEIEKLKKQLKKYDLKNAVLDIKQGFAYLNEKTDNPDANDQLLKTTLAIEESEKKAELYKSAIDSLKRQQELNGQIFRELQVQYPIIKNAIVQLSVILQNDSSSKSTYLALLSVTKNITAKEKQKIKEWLKLRLHISDITLIVKL